MKIQKTLFGTLPDGIDVDLFTLTNRNGMKVTMTNYGATILTVETPDRNGKLENVSLNFDTLEGYLQKDNPYIGCIVGRFANRIANAKFTLDGKNYTLFANAMGSSLHGGKKGFDKMVWKAVTVESADAAGVTFTYTSPDGEEGYPGNLQATVTYSLSEKNELIMEYSATTDQPTVINLTNHGYWNLAGARSGKVYDHLLTIHADGYLPLNQDLVATGTIEPVRGTPLDFISQPMSIGARIAQTDGGGYDRCYVLNKKPGETYGLAAKVVEPKSGRVMEIFTDQPGVQLYTSNFLNVEYAPGKRYGVHDAFCLETQQFPDAPNQPTFPSAVLRPGETYTQRTVHRFSVE